MPKEKNTRKSLLVGLLLVAGVIIPVISTGEEQTPTPRETNPQVHPSSKKDSPVTFSDVTNWARRSGNRVGEELSKAASKTVSAIKKAASGSKQEDRSEKSQ